jgi:hypothetical protein
LTEYQPTQGMQPPVDITPLFDLAAPVAQDARR